MRDNALWLYISKETPVASSDSNVLCTDSWRAFSSYANSNGLAHYRLNGVTTSKEYEDTMSNKHV